MASKVTSTSALTLAFLSLAAVSIPTAFANELLGTLPYSHGPPPLLHSGVFFSPTPQILLARGSGTASVHIHGRDFPDTTCEGHVFHVMGTCLVNGASVPYSRMVYEVWDWCTQVYVWDPFEVDLGTPGYFSVELIADNALGIGGVGISEWKIWTVGDPPDPKYEIVSAEFNQRVYQNGVDTAQLTVVTRSNWGDSDQLTLVADLESNLGHNYAMGSDGFGLSPGGEHTSHFYWSVPNEPHPWAFTLLLDLREQGQSYYGYQDPDAFEGMVLTPQQLEEFEEELSSSQCLPPGAACSFSMLAAIPHAGAPFGAALFVDAGCKMGERLRAGNYLGAGVAGLAGLIGGVDLVLDFLPGPGTVASAITGAAGTAIACTDDLILEDLYDIGRELNSRHSGIDSLAAHIRATFPEVEVEYSSEIMVRGGACLRIGVNDCWTNLDSLGLTGTFVFGTHGDTLNWAHVGPEPSPIGTGLPNPHSAIDIELHATSTDTLDLGFLYRHASQEVFWIRYDPFVVTDSSIAYLSVADTLDFFPVSLDLDGDGDIDQYIMPQGFSGIDAEQNARTLPAIHSLSAQPNPGISATTVSFVATRRLSNAAVVTYDVSGREIEREVLGSLGPGRHDVAWGTSLASQQVPSGVYYHRIVHADGQTKAMRMVLLR